VAVLQHRLSSWNVYGEILFHLGLKSPVRTLGAKEKIFEWNRILLGFRVLRVIHQIEFKVSGNLDKVYQFCRRQYHINIYI